MISKSNNVTFLGIQVGYNLLINQENTLNIKIKNLMSSHTVMRGRLTMST